jgi:hypothetical protein
MHGNIKKELLNSTNWGPSLLLSSEDNVGGGVGTYLRRSQ